MGSKLTYGADYGVTRNGQNPNFATLPVVAVAGIPTLRCSLGGLMTLWRE